MEPLDPHMARWSRLPRERVPVRTIAAVIGMVLATGIAVLLVIQLARVLIWIGVAIFFAVLLSPVTALAQRRLHLNRAAATFVVFLGSVLVIAGIVTVLVRPVASQGADLVKSAPTVVQEAAAGHGPVGDLLTRLHVQKYVTKYVADHPDLTTSSTQLAQFAPAVIRSVASGVAATVTVFVLAYLMVLEGPMFVNAWLGALPADRRDRVSRVAADCGKAVTGYMTGNLLISVIAGTITWVALLILGVPYAGVLAVFVGLTDLIPLVGATIGAVLVTLIAFLHGTTEGIVMAIVFVVYQQLENHLLQPVIMSRTVKLNPLTVLVSVLLGVELAGILGALLAIPVAGVIAVVARDLYDARRGRLKPEPTVGADEVPADRADT
jgi:predicted PurR-regulated permease PerM